MRNLTRVWRLAAAVAVLGAIAVLVSAGGSSASTGGSARAATSPATMPQLQAITPALRQTGPGLTEPTTGVGARIAGGTIRFAESPASPPNDIFPMYAPQYCGTNNIDDLDMLLYRPLYMYGADYDPTVDYADSIGQKPVYGNHGRTVTITLNHEQWSDGETVSARDLVFWMNVLRADPDGEWCGTVPGNHFFPGNVVSYRAVNATTFQMTMNRAYSPTWIQYNVLSQLTPMPMAWDRTSLKQKAPSPTARHLPDTTKRGAERVYNFLNDQGMNMAKWASSPLWRVVDGPWRVTHTTLAGGVTFEPNRDYSGPVKPSIAKFIEVPFDSERAVVHTALIYGASTLDIAYLPNDQTQLTARLESDGYDDNQAAYYGINFFPLNLHNPRVGQIFRQLYFRQALQHLVDQPKWIRDYLHGDAVPTYGPAPVEPRSTVLPGISTVKNPYPFSVAAAARLLTTHGWKVVLRGTTTCERPGTGAGRCGRGIKRGQGIAFNLDYLSGVTSARQEMTDLRAQAARVGIRIELTTHPFDDVYATAVRCTARQAMCAWTSENWGEGWIYGPDYLPTGEDLFTPNAVANYSNYDNATMNRLVDETIVGSAAHQAAAMHAYLRYAEKDLPVVWTPTSLGTFAASAGTLINPKIGGYAANALGFLTPEDWYLTK